MGRLQPKERDSERQEYNALESRAMGIGLTKNG